MWLLCLQLLQSKLHLQVELLTLMRCSIFQVEDDVNLCNQVVSAYEFELHAGAKTRHPTYHIYLENGNPIYSIIQELRTAPLSTVDGVIKAVAGPSVNEEYLQVWKGKM